MPNAKFCDCGRHIAVTPAERGPAPQPARVVDRPPPQPPPRPTGRPVEPVYESLQVSSTEGAQVDDERDRSGQMGVLGRWFNIGVGKLH